MQQKTMTRGDLEEEPEKLVESFHNHLKQEKGLSEETASGHAHQIGFFALHYLTGYEVKSLLEVTSSDIEDYLGNWYIRKVWGSGKSDVRSILVAFKKFYKFLHERGSVEEEQLSDILSACKNPQRYIRRFESYLELDPESETWDEDFRNWFMSEYEEEEIEVNYEQQFEVNPKISRAKFSNEDLFDAMWNETRWEKFLPPDSGGRPGYVQEERGNIASALSKCEVDEKYLLVEWLKEFCREQVNEEDEYSVLLMAASFVYSVFDVRIVPALKLFGLLDFGYKKDRKEQLVNRGWGIEWFAITKQGKKIFRGII